jgi:hypothetical protein
MIDLIKKVLEDRINTDYKKILDFFKKKTSYGLYLGKKNSSK